MAIPLNTQHLKLDLQRERPITGRIDSPKLQLVEIFDSLQGEGPDIGLPARFVRLAHCNRRCSWCDTDYSLRFELSIEEFAKLMLADYAQVKPPELAYVIFTGGEPTLHAQQLNAAIGLLASQLPIDWFWACESNGTLLKLPAVREFYARMQRIVLSPKPPSSQNPPFAWEEFWREFSPLGLNERTVIKPVIMDDADMAWFREAAESPARPLEIPFIMQTYVDPDPSSNAMADFRGYWQRTLTPQFIAWMRRYNVRLLPRLHNLIWGNQQGF